MVVVIVIFLTVPGRMPQYEHPSSVVLLLGIVLNVRLLLPLLLVLTLLLLLALVVPLLLLLTLLLLLEQTTPAGQGPLPELLAKLLPELLLLGVVVVLSSRVCSVVSSLVVPVVLVVRWSNFSPIPVGRLYAFRVNATARIKNRVIVKRPSLCVMKISLR